jgi:TolB-like protein/Tfp pilus assembly protein PilF
MLSGRQPFAAESAAATASAILTYEPPPLARFAPDTPDELQRIIRKCLEKDRERRYQTMRDAALDLETVRREHDAAQIATSRGREAPTSGAISAPVPSSARHSLFGSWRALAVTLTALVLVISVLVYGLFFRKRVVPVASDIKSLAVLPLENLSGDPDQEYLADGVHEALITDLAKLSGFRRVVARTSVIRYRKSEKSLAQIARELGVDALITGSVLRSGNRVQVTAHLLNATTEEQIWGDRYERELRDVLSLQNEIVTAIARGVKLKLAPSDQQQLAGGRAVNQEAYEAYLKGQFYLNKFTPEGFERGLAYLHQAVEKDPTNPLAYSQLAVAYSLVGHDIIPNAFIEAKAAAHKALELDSNSAEAYQVLAEIKLYADWDDWQGAADNFQRALALNPNLAMGHRNYSWYLNLMGRSTEGIAEMKRAAEIDPMNPLFHEDLGWQYWDLSQSDKAIEEARKALELDPNFPYALLLLALVHGERGMYTEAIAAAQRLAQVEPDLRWGLAMSYARAGRKDQALRIVDEIKKEPSPWADWGLAQIYAVLGDREETLRWLEQGFQDRFSLMPWLRLRDAGLERPFKPFRDDLRYQDLLRRMNLME